MVEKVKYDKNPDKNSALKTRFFNKIPIFKT